MSQSVNHLPEQVLTMSPVYTLRGEGIPRRDVFGEGVCYFPNVYLLLTFLF